MSQLFGIKLKRFLKHRYEHDFELVVILENVQYARNVAESFRISDALKVSKIILTGISQQPPFGKDLVKVSRAKEKSIPWEYEETSGKAISKLKKKGFTVVAVELTEAALDLPEFLGGLQSKKIAVIVGNEGYGIVKSTLALVDNEVILPMFGKGASLNVSVSLAVFLYTLILSA
jgi:tRNA G18 (ribose-2'-O)-methylase SpoU